MASIIIGLFLSILLIYNKQIGRNKRFKVLSFSICFLFSLTLLLLTDLGWWYIIVLPVFTFIGVFLSLIISPFTLDEAFESREVVIHDYYNELPDEEQIGFIKTYGFKQGYERLLNKVLYAFTSSNTDAEKIMHNLYSNIYYPSSKILKVTLVNHVHESLDKVIDGTVYLTKIRETTPNIYAYVFNIFICILQINEEATDNIKRLEMEKKEQMQK